MIGMRDGSVVMLGGGGGGESDAPAVFGTKAAGSTAGDPIAAAVSAAASALKPPGGIRGGFGLEAAGRDHDRRVVVGLGGLGAGDLACIRGQERLARQVRHRGVVIHRFFERGARRHPHGRVFVGRFQCVA